MMDREQLAQHYSDYHKDVYGFRPRHVGEMSEAEICERIDMLDNYIEMVSKDPILRKQFEADGWIFD